MDALIIFGCILAIVLTIGFATLDWVATVEFKLLKERLRWKK